MINPTADRRRVLISGASIAGPTLAFWLESYGFDVTVVERASSIRSGGYPIDVRGTAIDVIARMGLLEEVRAAHIAQRKFTFVDDQGQAIAAIPPKLLTASTDHDIELPRGILTSALVSLTRSTSVRYRFDDSIVALDDSGGDVTVSFKRGDSARFDIVIGADGLHSNTRKLVFGPEDQFRFDLGSGINLFSMPNDLGLSHEAVIYVVPGRSAGFYATKENPTVHAVLMFSTEKRSFNDQPSIEEQRQLTTEIFSGLGWEVPRMLEAMQYSDDLYFDTISQIRMPVWSKGRIALVGDAAYAPSLLTGQGTSLALVGAYVLAGELALHRDPKEAFSAYESTLKPFVEANQAIATPETIARFLPRTIEDVEALITMASGHYGLSDYVQQSKVHSSLQLSEYRILNAI
jgi:2-polyprenyl-6-methoxyphenol hydroxylase-like FAD-dependent oxidoreductase